MISLSFLDKKTDESNFSHIFTKRSKLSYVPLKDRINIRWGDISQEKAELEIFEYALSQNKYQYLHLISGQDLPLQSQDYIHNFFDNLLKGTNLVGIAQSEYNKFDLARRSKYFYFY